MFVFLAIFMVSCISGQPLNISSNEVILETAIKYDNSFLDLHNGDTKEAVAWINKVVKETKPLLLELDVKVHLEVIGDIEYKNVNLSPDPESMDRLRGQEHKTPVLTSYFSGFKAGPGQDSGLANLGEACDTKGSAIAIVSPAQNIAGTARILAHELGHTMGMKHDDQNQAGGPCNEPSGMMAPTVAADVNSWTSCSNAELALWLSTPAMCVGNFLV